MTDTIPQTNGTIPQTDGVEFLDSEGRRYRIYDTPVTPTGGAQMDLTTPDLNLMRQWFDAVQDVSPEYLEAKDFALARRLYERLGIRVPNSMKDR